MTLTSRPVVPRLLHLVGPSLGLRVLAIALVAARGELAGVRPADVASAWCAIGPARFAVAAALTAASYAVLAGYELLAVRTLGVDQPARRVLFAGATAWAV